MSAEFERNFMTRMRDVIGEEPTEEQPTPTIPPPLTTEQHNEVQRFIRTDPDDDDEDDDNEGSEEWIPEPTRKKKGKPGPKPKPTKSQKYKTKAFKQMENMLLGTKLLLSRGKCSVFHLQLTC